MDFWLLWMYLHPFCTKFPWSFSSKCWRHFQSLNIHTCVFYCRTTQEKNVDPPCEVSLSKSTMDSLVTKKRWIETFLITFFHIKRPSSCVWLYRPNSHKTQKSFTLPIRPTYMLISLLLTCTTTCTIMDYIHVLWK